MDSKVLNLAERDGLVLRGLLIWRLVVLRRQVSGKGWQVACASNNSQGSDQKSCQTWDPEGIAEAMQLAEMAKAQIMEPH